MIISSLSDACSIDNATDVPNRRINANLKQVIELAGKFLTIEMKGAGGEAGDCSRYAAL